MRPTRRRRTPSRLSTDDLPLCDTDLLDVPIGELVWPSSASMPRSDSRTRPGWIFRSDGNYTSWSLGHIVPDRDLFPAVVLNHFLFEEENSIRVRILGPTGIHLLSGTACVSRLNVKSSSSAVYNLEDRRTVRSRRRKRGPRG